MFLRSISRPSSTITTKILLTQARGMSAAEAGSGAGKGGGSGGSIREAGGSMGKKGAAQEEAYFTKQNNAIKQKLKEHLQQEIKAHEESIKKSKAALSSLE